MTMKRETASGGLIAIGKLTGVFGIKGYLKMQIYADDPSRVLKLRKIFLGKSPGEVTEYGVEDVEIQHASTVIKFSAVDTRTDAETLRGNFVFVKATAATKLPKGAYFVHDIIG